MNLKAQKWKFTKRADSLQGFIVHNEVCDCSEIKADRPWQKPCFLRPRHCTEIWMCVFPFRGGEGGVRLGFGWQCSSPWQPRREAKKLRARWSLAARSVHWSKGHSASLSCPSAGILIKEDTQKTIASSTTRKPNGIAHVDSQTIRHWNCWWSPQQGES